MGVLNFLAGVLLLLSVSVHGPCVMAQIPTIPQDPKITTPTGSRSLCYAVVDFQLACQQLTPNWTALPPTEQAKCYCYDTISSSYVPSIYDNAAQGCYDGYLKTGQPDDATWYSNKNIGACTRFAGPGASSMTSGLGVSSVTTGPITPAPTASSPIASQTIAQSTISKNSGMLQMSPLNWEYAGVIFLGAILL